MEKPSELIKRHLKGIQGYRERICEISNYLTMYEKRESKIRNLKDDDSEMLLEFETEEDFIVAAYTLTGYLSLCAFYTERIDFHATEICAILKEFDIDDDSINSLYEGLTGPFYIDGLEGEKIFHEFSEIYLNNSRERFSDIYNNNYYETGKEYLSSLKFWIYEANRMSTYRDNIMDEYINALLNSLKPT